MLVEILLLVIGLALFLVSKTRKPKNFPPGLPRLPIVGSMPYLKPGLFRLIPILKKNTGYFNYHAVGSISPLPSGFWLVPSVEFAASKLTF